jgi:hypothetical protein
VKLHLLRGLVFFEIDNDTAGEVGCAMQLIIYTHQYIREKKEWFDLYPEPDRKVEEEL